MRALTFEEFRDREGDSFELVLDGERKLPLTLIRVEELPATGREGGAFTLEWLGPYEPVLEQATYDFRDGEDGFEMFIVPIRQDRDGTRYEAVFN